MRKLYEVDPEVDERCRHCVGLLTNPFYVDEDTGETFCTLSCVVQYDEDQAERQALASSIPEGYAEQ